MDLNLEQPGDHLFIRSFSNEGIQVVDDVYVSSIILSARQVVADWPVSSVEQITAERLKAVLELDPEVVLIGTGTRQAFLPPELMMFFYSRNIGIEAMTTDAACRTFNVLVSESRRVVAALISA
ncbi:MAG: Xcc1710-like domain-containing protein [Xanthomonadales bacterium]|nr:Mth938-like domain-containing protein [Gammaproteobacteria bacterium]MBT8053332.1 Mth938-like domain-containing protein [Gammaproteobacteria bacterium]NND58044.1 Xcc1710-like domain-containing protein [Xanthomonadales bacterium]NNK52141.1 Xcc1710-like domain-containing protein [Xanthomonadales bacterium]